MAKMMLKNASIKGIACVVGENEFLLEEHPCLYNNNQKQLNRLQSIAGLSKHYVANNSTTASDLGLQASKNLLNALDISAKSIDAIVSITQTPDYIIPANASVFHKELDCSKDCQIIDINSACAGYIVGLQQAFMLLNSGLKRILLVAGDTYTKYVNTKDKISAPIFGDGVSATIIDYDKNAEPTYFILKADGASFEYIYQKAGACRYPSTDATRTEVEDEQGNFRSAENFYMNGFEVFNFTMNEQPPLLQELLDYSRKNKDEIDYYVLHQSNKLIISTIANQLDINLAKFPYETLKEYGNLTSASIASVLCYELANKLANDSKELILHGYGVGLAWGACKITLNNLKCLQIEVYKKTKE